MQEDDALISGIYGLVNLDGRPIDAADAARLGLADRPAAAVFAGRGGRLPDAVEMREAEGAVTVMVGWFAEPEELARQLHLAQDAPRLAIAEAAMAAWGAQLPARALGDYTLLRWTREAGLRVVCSAPRRDRLFVARMGNRVALAPDIQRLSRLGWVGRSLDLPGYLFAISQYPVREQRQGRSFFKGIRELAPGESWWCRAQGEGVQNWPGWREADTARFTGDIHEAVDEAESVLRRIVAAQLQQGGTPGVMLSGGLDSTLLAWLATSCGARPACLTSVAPEGSGLADEWAHAGQVCAALGLPQHRVRPLEEASPFTPTRAELARALIPPQVIKAALYDAFAARAAELGIATLLDGCFGEMTVTGMTPFDTPAYRLRQFARRMAGRGDVPILQPSLSGVRLAPALLQHLPEPVAEAWRQAPPPGPRRTRRGQPWHFPPGESMRLAVTSESGAAGVRRAFPFRDLRLWRLFARFPTDFLRHQGMDRAPARLMLQGHVPEPIRLQAKGLPFSPDYLPRLRRMAPAALALVPVYRRAGLAEWFDLDWLEGALQRVAGGRQMGVQALFSAQLTAMNAEFLYRLMAE